MESKGTTVVASCIHQALTDSHRYTTLTDATQTVEFSLMKRYGTLDEQTAPICFLASREASYITGSVLPVSGGDQG